MRLSKNKPDVAFISGVAFCNDKSKPGPDPKIMLTIITPGLSPGLKYFCYFTFRDVKVGDVATVGECRPLSKTVKFNTLKITKGAGNKKAFAKF